MLSALDEVQHLGQLDASRLQGVGVAAHVVAQEQALSRRRGRCAVAGEIHPKGSPRLHFGAGILQGLPQGFAVHAFVEKVHAVGGHPSGVDEEAVHGLGVAGREGHVGDEGVVLDADDDRGVGRRGGPGLQGLVDRW